MHNLMISHRNNRDNSNFHAQPWLLSHTSQPSKYPHLTLNHDNSNFFALVSSLGKSTIVSSGEKDSALGHGTSSYLTSTLRRSSDVLKLRIEKSTTQAFSATATRPPKIMKTNSSSSGPPSVSPVESLRSAVNFANRCLVRSYERRSRSNLTILPSYSIDFPLEPSSKQSIARMSSSISSSSATTRESISVASYESMCISSNKIPISGRQSSSREQEIRIKLLRTKIIIYRQKCVRSGIRVIIHYDRLNAISSSRKHDRESGTCINYAGDETPAARISLERSPDRTVDHSTTLEKAGRISEGMQRFTDGRGRNIPFHRKKSSETRSVMTESTIFSSFRSKNEDSLSSSFKEAGRKTPTVIRKLYGGGRRRIFSHRKDLYDTQSSITNFTMSSSFCSNSENSIFGEASLENGRVDLAEIGQECNGDLCGSFFLEKSVGNKHSTLLRFNEMSPEFGGSSTDADCKLHSLHENDVIIEDCFSSFFGNFMRKFIVQKEPVVTC